MRVLLINPYYPISETPSPPLGLACLAGALEHAGADVRILDFVVAPYSLSVIEEVLSSFAPDLVGVTSVTMTFDDAISIVQDVRNRWPEVRTVMGGPHVSFRAEETLSQFPELDFVVRGEGEQAIVRLAEAVSLGNGWKTVPGLVYRDGTAIVSNPRSKRPPDLDDLPFPARHHLMLGRYRALGLPVSMTTSRGCPHHCIFCVGHRMNGRSVRYRHPVAVVDEMESLSRLGFHQVNLADDLFTANPAHCRAVCEEIVRRGLIPAWTAFARVDSVSRDLLEEMKSAGCHTVSFGVESANPGILKTARKGITPRQIFRAVRECVESGMTPQVSFILGLPGETPETMRQSIDLGKKLKSMGALHGFHLLAPFPGTDVCQKAREYGIRILHSNWRQYHANRAVAETPTVSHHMLDDFISRWEEKFDEYLGDIRQRMATGEASAGEAWQLTRLEHTVILYELMMKRCLERYGTWRNGTGQIKTKDALDELTQRIGTGDNFTRAQLLDTLTFAYNGGNLDYHREDGVIRWKWVDYLQG